MGCSGCRGGRSKKGLREQSFRFVTVVIVCVSTESSLTVMQRGFLAQEG